MRITQLTAAKKTGYFSCGQLRNSHRSKSISDVKFQKYFHERISINGIYLNIFLFLESRSIEERSNFKNIGYVTTATLYMGGECGSGGWGWRDQTWAGILTPKAKY